MGKRLGRKKTLNVKKAEVRENGSTGYECKAQSMYIDGSACEVYQARHPERCFGCRKFRG